LPNVGGFSLGTPASSTTKADRHDMAEILLKVAFKHQKINHSNQNPCLDWGYPKKQCDKKIGEQLYIL
jgi:hypothetical protein